MICCISPFAEHLAETTSTLEFASRAKLVRTHAVVNAVLDDAVEVRRLRRELEALKVSTKLEEGAQRGRLEEREKENSRLQNLLASAVKSSLEATLVTVKPMQRRSFGAVSELSKREGSALTSFSIPSELRSRRLYEGEEVAEAKAGVPTSHGKSPAKPLAGAPLLCAPATCGVSQCMPAEPAVEAANESSQGAALAAGGPVDTSGSSVANSNILVGDTIYPLVPPVQGMPGPPPAPARSSRRQSQVRPVVTDSARLDKAILMQQFGRFLRKK